MLSNHTFDKIGAKSVAVKTSANEKILKNIPGAQKVFEFSKL